MSRCYIQALQPLDCVFIECCEVHIAIAGSVGWTVVQNVFRSLESRSAVTRWRLGKAPVEHVVVETPNPLYEVGLVSPNPFEVIPIQVEL